jgi:magnesium chelatase subunit I
LRHRRREAPAQQPPSPAPAQSPASSNASAGQGGDSGALPAQPVAAGPRREVPNWAKKP